MLETNPSDDESVFGFAESLITESLHVGLHVGNGENSRRKFSKLSAGQFRETTVARQGGESGRRLVMTSLDYMFNLTMFTLT